jgi:RNA polymerase sigma-70 factor, ECF subfamily
MMEGLAQLPAGGEPAARQDDQLVSAVLRKDRKATAEFVGRCSDWIYPFLSVRLSPRKDVIEDLMQDILISAWRSLSTFRAEAGLRAWILGIARHKVEDYYRRRIREAASQEDDLSEEPATGFSIEDHMDAAANRERVQQIIARIPEAYALALTWRYRDGKSLREIAELTGKTEKAIERLLARARAAFKKGWNHDQS